METEDQMRERHRERYRKMKNNTDFKRKLWENRIRWFYKIEPEDVARAFDGQGGKCALCETALMFDRETHIDHDHETGRFRGLLCQMCNNSLGHMEKMNWLKVLNYLRGDVSIDKD